ncbi:MAG TPA: NADH:flavin oxidoreductase/NADH oxidase [Candidatus Limnocylindrales bacterium]|nr:NADH:flavin oxidoreductase/NADH oxidase [Candidatus Limnocylindrales bacterium]
MPHLFSPFTLRGVTLRNRIGMSPMCQYSCEARDGQATDWHRTHLASRAVGGCGLVIVEASAVDPRGRITPQDLGIWNDSQIDGLAGLTYAIRENGAVAGIQIAHAGRKAATSRPWEGSMPLSDADGGWGIVAPSALPYGDAHRTPEALTVEAIEHVITGFVRAAQRANTAGFDWLELHGAHGYLLHSFLSPVTNQRSDAYGGSFEGRARLMLEVTSAVRAVWPDHKPLTVRLSASDWLEDGWQLADSIELAKQLGPLGVDLIDCSSGGIRPHVSVPTGPGYNVPFSEAIRQESGLPTAAVGYITTPEQAEAVLVAGQADVILLGRQLLREPYWALRAAAELDGRAGTLMPPQYRWAL